MRNFIDPDMSLVRFVQAQDDTYASALNEIREFEPTYMEETDITTITNTLLGEIELK